MGRTTRHRSQSLIFDSVLIVTLVNAADDRCLSADDNNQIEACLYCTLTSVAVWNNKQNCSLHRLLMCTVLCEGDFRID